MARIFCLIVSMVFVSQAFAEEAKSNLNWDGSFRYRHEWVSSGSSAPSSYHRHRINAKLGATAQVNDETDVSMRLATGSGAQSTNQTLGSSSNAFQNYSIKLDRAYFDWAGLKGFHFLGGRTPNFFSKVGEGDLVFDTDLNFDGLGFQYSTPISDVQLMTNFGYFWVDESYSSSNLSNNHLIAPQIGVQYKLDNYTFTFAPAYYVYTGFTNQTVFGSANGNSTVSGNYKTDFRVLELPLEVSTQLMGKCPAALYGQYIMNTAADTENKGYLAGLSFGKLKQKSDWKLSYDYRMLKMDAMVSAFVDADSINGGTDGNSHRVKVAYQLAKNMNAGVSVYLGKSSATTGETRANKGHFDLNFKF